MTNPETKVTAPPTGVTPFAIWLLHGTFQSPQVWQSLALSLSEDGHRVETVDLYATAASSMETWADRFCRRVDAMHPGWPRLVLGYSLGGRLALHALLACPKRWRGAILVSTDPGIAEERARAERRRADAAWAERVLTEPLARLLADWNAQPVFGGRQPAEATQDIAYSRDILARPFYVYSKGYQRDMLPQLAAPSMPDTLWITGEDDAPYSARAQSVAHVVANATHCSVAGGGHRVPWEAPAEFCAATRKWIAGLTPPPSNG